jgi:hypothetical protein
MLTPAEVWIENGFNGHNSNNELNIDIYLHTLVTSNNPNINTTNITNNTSNNVQVNNNLNNNIDLVIIIWTIYQLIIIMNC